MVQMEDIDTTSIEDEKQLEQIRSVSHKKSKLSLLNQRRVSDWELDEIFLSNEEYEEEF